eukprot:105220_1
MEQRPLSSRLTFGPQYGATDPLSRSPSQSHRTPNTDLSNDSQCGCISKFFKLHERGSNLTTEIKAGFATFITMAYILAVNAAILSEIGGECKSDDAECKYELMIQLAISTAIVSFISTAIMGLWANLPLALAPGMGMNAYFVYTVVGTEDTQQMNYDTALLITGIEGVIFLLLSCCVPCRVFIETLIPLHLKAAIITGIGLFLAFIGLQKMNISVTSQTTGVTNATINLSKEKEIFDIELILGIVGLILMIIGMAHKTTRQYCILSVFVLITAISCVFSDTRKNLENGWGVPDINKSIIKFGNIDIDGQQKWDLFKSICVFLIINLLDTTGALYGMADYGNFIRNDDFEESIKKAFYANGIGTIIGCFFGTPPVTTFVESCAGIREGGKTGITAIVVSMCFLIAFFVSPLFVAIPKYATGPVLIVIGTLMTRRVNVINWDDLRQAFPAFITLAVMNDTYSIALGIFAGIFVNLLLVIEDKICKMCGFYASDSYRKISSDGVGIVKIMEQKNRSSHELNNNESVSYWNDNNNNKADQMEITPPYKRYNSWNSSNENDSSEQNLIGNLRLELNRLNTLSNKLFPHHITRLTEHGDLQKIIDTIHKMRNILQDVFDEKDIGSTDTITGNVNDVYLMENGINNDSKDIQHVNQHNNVIINQNQVVIDENKLETKYKLLENNNHQH